MNKFGMDFIALLQNSSYSLINFSEVRTVEFFKDNKKFFLPIIFLSYKDFSFELIKNCYQIAMEKAKKTMPQDQAGNVRPQKIKIINQFRGILAETIVHLYLYYKCGVNIKNILRYDLERDSFDYSSEEYDLKIILEQKRTIDLEVRSSNNPYDTLSEYLARRGIICAYTNIYKQKEKLKDLSLAVIYDAKKHSGALSNQDRENFFKELKNNDYQIYFVPHCATKKSVIQYGEKKNYGQKKTEYLQVPFYAITPQKYHIHFILNYLNKDLG